MATRSNLIATYQNNPTLQSQYTQQQYLDLFGFGANQPQPDPDPTPPDPTPPVENIIGQNLNQGGGGGGIQGLQQTFTRTQPRAPKFDPNINPSFTLTGKGRLDPMGSDIDYFNSFRAQNDPRAFTSGLSIDKIGSDSRYFEEPSMFNKGITGIKNFFTDNRFFQPKVKGTLGTRLANQPRIPLPLSVAAYARSPFNKASPTYNPFMEQQLNFLEGATGTKITGTSDNLKFTEGQAMIGRDPNSGLLKYGPGTVLEGKNVMSFGGFNDYGTALDSYIDKMISRGTIDGVFDEANLSAFQLAKLNKAKKEKQVLFDKEITRQIQEKEQKALQDKIAAEVAAGKSLSQIGRENFTGEGQAFQAGNIGKQTVTGGKVQKSSSVPGGKYGSPRKDGGLMYADGGRVYLYNRLK